MKNYYYLIFVITLFILGCGPKDDDQVSNKFPDQTDNPPAKTVKVSDDTLMGGDTFATTGPAGKMDYKQGKIVVIADSGLALPVKIDEDNKIIAMGLTDSTAYEVKREGDHTAIMLPDSGNHKNGKMMLLTDDGEMLEVKLLGDQIVVLTRNNTMLPLEKK